MFTLVTSGNVSSRLQTCYSETINPLENPIIVVENDCCEIPQNYMYCRFGLFNSCFGRKHRFIMMK